MAETAVTQTGREAMVAAVTRFPDAVTAALRAVARDTAGRVQQRAKDILLGQLKTDATKLADNITVEEDAANKQFLVISRPPVGQPTNITIWNEYGTSKMLARPYMHPAAVAEERQYERDMAGAAVDVAANIFGGG